MKNTSELLLRNAAFYVTSGSVGSAVVRVKVRRVDARIINDDERTSIRVVPRASLIISPSRNITGTGFFVFKNQIDASISSFRH